MLKEERKAGRQEKLAKQMREEMRSPGGEKNKNKVAEVEKSECPLRKSRLGQEDTCLSRGLLQVRSC